MSRSELTCDGDKDYDNENESIMMLTDRMKKVTIGACEWTVAELPPMQVAHKTYIAGNAWGTW